MMTAYTTDDRYRPGVDMIAENHNLKLRIAELEAELMRLGRLNMLLNAEVEYARREREERERADQEARDAELWEIVERQTRILHDRQRREQAALKAEYGERVRAGRRREWR